MKVLALSSCSEMELFITSNIEKVKSKIEVEIINEESNFDDLSWQCDIAIIDDASFLKYDYEIKSLIYSKLNENNIEVIVLLENLSRIDVYYSLNLADYFLAPIDWHRFLLRVRSIEKNVKSKGNLIKTNLDRRVTKFAVKIQNEVLVISYDKIRYFKKDGKKLLIYLDDEVITVNESFKELIIRLPRNFIRVHNSYIVNTKHISRIIEHGNRAYYITFEGCDDIAHMSRYKSAELLNEYYKLR